MNFLNSTTQAFFVYASCCTPSAATGSQPQPITLKSASPTPPVTR